MKKFLMIVVLLLIPVMAQAAGPFLVCATVPATSVQPSSYTVVLDTAPSVDVLAQVNTDGSVQLHWDLANVTTGAHVVGVKAKNIWGESANVPFSFTKAIPGAPTSIGISPQ